MTDSQSFLNLVGVSKSFGANEVLRPTDLMVEQGEFFTLLGPSGCGKTTLLRIISGFEQATVGWVELRGKRLDLVPPERRPFNMVFQSYALFPHMTVGENVAYGLRIAGRSRSEIGERVAQALGLVHLREAVDRSVTELSGGQQQRVALARALVNEPEVLLLDEPLGALDLKLRKHLQTELREIQHRLGTTFVYVTHDQEEALTLSHRIALVNYGEVVQVGTPREVYERPTTRFAADFVGEANLVSCVVVESRTDGAVVRFYRDGGAVAELSYFGDQPLAPGAEVWAALRPEHLEFRDPADAVFTGPVRETVFLGTHCRHHVEVEGGHVLRVSGPAEESPVADTTGIGIRPGKGVVVLTDDAAGASVAQAAGVLHPPALDLPVEGRMSFSSGR